MADSRSLSEQMFIQAAASPGSSRQQQQHYHHHHLQQQHQYGMLQGIPSSCPSNIMTHTGADFVKDNPGAYDLGELDQALFMYLEGDPTAMQKQYSGDRPPTLNIFPSRPMHFEASPPAISRATSISGAESFDSESAHHTISHKRGPPQPEFDSQTSVKKSEPMEASDQIGRNISTASKEITSNDVDKDIKHELNRKGPTSTSDPEGTKATDPKTLRRLAQNREAARKSRLRKKAYVQQLESSRMKLNQIEQELQRARAQGIFVGANGFLNDQGLPTGHAVITSEAAAFDMEYQRWLEEHHRHMCDLRAALQEHLSDGDLRLFVDNCVAHYSEILHIKSVAAKADVFHLLSGMWKTPAERCFMWIGGFRPSELLKILLPHIEPLTEQQYQCICSLQQSSVQAEEALSQGMEELQQSLLETIAAGSLSSPANMGNYMGQMAIAIGKLANLEFLIRQADSLRHQTLQQLHRILTTRQAAKCFLAIGEYFSRLRALSSLWSARPRE